MTRPVFGPQDPEDSRSVIRSIDEDGIAVFGQVGIQEIAYQGRFGAIARSTTLNSIAIGDHYFTLDTDTGMFRIGDDILMTALDDPSSCFMWGEIIDADTVDEPKRIRVYVDDISNLIGDFANWEIQVVARPKPGIEKDTSTSSVDPFGAGPFTFTVTAGKFFPIGGQLLLKPLSDRKIALLGRVLSYTGTTLTVAKTETNATGSQSYNTWSIALLDAPGIGIPIHSINGLVMSQNGIADLAHDFLVKAGSVRDSTDSIDLILENDVVKRMDAVHAAGTNQGACAVKLLTGTMTCAGTPAVTGTGSSFLTQFAQYSVLQASAGDFGYAVQSVTNDTSLTLQTNGFSGSPLVARGGYMLGNGIVLYWISLARRDSDGLVDVIASSFRPGDVLYTEPSSVDLPAGYTYFRTLGFIQIVDTDIQTIVNMLGASQNAGVLVSPATDTSHTADVFPNFRIADGVDSVETRDNGAGGVLEFKLVNDLTAPGNNKVYGTDGSGVRGWKDDPAGGGGGVPTDWGLITDPIDASAILDFGTIV